MNVFQSLLKRNEGMSKSAWAEGWLVRYFNHYGMSLLLEFCRRIEMQDTKMKLGESEM